MIVGNNRGKSISMCTKIDKNTRRGEDKHIESMAHKHSEGSSGTDDVHAAVFVEDISTGKTDFLKTNKRRLKIRS